MGNFIYDMKYLLSKDNTSSRGFYWGVVIGSLAVLIGGIASGVVGVIGLLKGVSGVKPILSIGVLPLAIALVLLVFFMLRKKH